MARVQELLAENDANMSWINAKIRGKPNLQQDVLRVIIKHEVQLSASAAKASAAALGRRELAVQKRYEAIRLKRKRENDECPRDAYGAHLPVISEKWEDENGHIENGENNFNTRLRNMSEWKKTIFSSYSPSLSLRSSVEPLSPLTHSLR